MNEPENAKPACPPVVIVKISGGVVQGTVSNVPGIDVLVLDYDTDGTDDDQLAHFPEKGGDVDAADAYYVSPLHDDAYTATLVAIKEDFDDRQEEAREAANVQG